MDLEKLFTILRKENLKAKAKKCKFGFKETKFLGYIISNEGLKADPFKIECVKNYPVPKNTKNVKMFLGLASYYRKFIENFSDIAEPLTKLTRHKYKFEWTPECQNAFEKLKSALISYPVLMYPDFDKRRITTDASCVGLGAILSQIDKKGNERPISYASRTLQPAERNYCTTELELLAIIWELEHFRPYVYGVEFDLITDHKALTYLTDLKNCSARLSRWKLRLSEYSFNIIHKPGKLNINADALSRMYEINSMNEIPAKLSFNEIKSLQQNDTEIIKLFDDTVKHGNKYNNLLVENGILYCFKKKVKSYEPQNAKRLVIPQELVPYKLDLCHDGFAGAHLGENKTWSKVANKFFWPSMRDDITNWVRSCPVCSSKKDPIPGREILHPLSQPDLPFDRIGIDYIGPLPDTDNGNRHILVITDYATRWAEAFATKDQKASTVAQILIDEIICRYSAPREILSDQGTNFLSSVVKQVCEYFRIRKINTTSYHPQTNGLTEKFNHTLCKMLSSYTNETQTNWDLFLPMALFAYRTSIQKSSNESPFKLLFAREARLPADIDHLSPNHTFIDKIHLAWKEAK